jgi:hypothetical protein
MKISVLALFRDSEKIIYRTLGLLDNLERSTDAQFSFFFYENDSVDNTAKILEDWLSTKEGKLISEKLNYPKFGSVSSEERFSLMSYYRNKLAESVKPLDSDFTLILDSDVIIYNDLINDYMKYMTHNSVMLTSNTVVKSIDCKMGGSGPVYYDSLALTDIHGYSGMTWSSCPFYHASDRQKWEIGSPVLVKHAFGGAALIRSSILNIIDWSSTGYCEHWAFCDQAGLFGDIFVVPTIMCEVEASIDDIPQTHINSVIENQKRNYDFINFKH